VPGPDPEQAFLTQQLYDSAQDDGRESKRNCRCEKTSQLKGQRCRLWDVTALGREQLKGSIRKIEKVVLLRVDRLEAHDADGKDADT
jgi:hypothetical protein